MSGLLLKTAASLLFGGLAFGQCSAAPSAGAPGGEIRVSTPQALEQELATARGGETILLAPGKYRDLRIRDRRFPALLTIKAAGAGVELGRLQMKGVSNIRFEGVAFHLKLASAKMRHVAAIQVNDGAGIRFEKVHVHGSLDSDPSNDGYGLRVIDGRDVAVRNSRFEQLAKGMVFQRVDGVQVTGNEILALRSDGADFAQVSRVVIDGNHIRDFYPAPGDHPDAIQFFTKGTAKPSTDIRITNNVIIQGSGEGMQGIFLKDETGNLPYREVLIANNLVYMNTYTGIGVANARGLKVRGNTVLSQPGDKYKLRIVLWDADDAELTDNVADIYLPFDSTGVELAGNLFIEDAPRQARLIPNLGAGTEVTVADLIIPGRGFQPSAANTSTSKQ